MRPALAAALALVLAGCSSGTTRSTVPGAGCSPPAAQPGAGVPEGFPRDIPLPDGATILLSQADARLRRVVVLVGSDLDPLFRLYERELPARGYRIDLRERDAFDWEIIFSKGSDKGDIAARQVCTPGTSAVSLTFVSGR